GVSNSPSRLRSGFSPSVVRKSRHRERMFPAMCFTIRAMQFDSPSIVASRASSGHCASARSASFLYIWNKLIESRIYEVENWCAIAIRLPAARRIYYRAEVAIRGAKEYGAQETASGPEGNCAAGKGGSQGLTFRFLFAYNAAAQNRRKTGRRRTC